MPNNEDNVQVEQLIDELAGGVGMKQANARVGESLIGLFQAYRPDGLPDAINFQAVDGGPAFLDRLGELYSAVRSSRRSDSMKDAYFIVRDPPMLDAERAELLATALMDKLAILSKQLQLSKQLDTSADVLERRPVVRILEGKAPRHPKPAGERSELLKFLFDQLPEMVGSLFPQGSLGDLLAEPLYFVATDRMLRDYLRWPLGHAREIVQLDAYAEYFELWRHGAKLRVISEGQVDVYLPRRADGQLIESTAPAS